jgi:hypothetical protein
LSAARDIVVKKDAVASLGLNREKLPQLYIAAKAALRECVNLDEIKDIGDKHSAIAHYATQAKDQSLLTYAQRIQLRAFERLGELLKEIPNDEERSAMARRFGIAAVTARRAFETAHIPKRVRDKMIESSPVPSRKRLADAGDGYVPRNRSGYNRRFRRHVDREEDIKAPPARRAIEVVDYLRSTRVDLEDFLGDGCGGAYTMTQLGGAVDPEDAADARSLIQYLFRSLESFRQALPHK